VSDDRCSICTLIAEPPRGGLVYEDAYFAATIHAGGPIPGWLILSLKRHELPLTSLLTDDEAAALGPAMRRLVAAIVEAVDAERVYATLFGEGAAHWHMLLAARAAHIPQGVRQAELLRHVDDYADLESAVRAADRIREALAAAGAG